MPYMNIVIKELEITEEPFLINQELIVLCIITAAKSHQHIKEIRSVAWPVNKTILRASLCNNFLAKSYEILESKRTICDLFRKSIYLVLCPANLCKVSLAVVDDADWKIRSERIDPSINGGTVERARNITINVSRNKNYANLGSVTATLTPTFGGAENRTGTRSGDGSISIEMITPGTYNLTVNAQSNFSTPSSQQVTIVGGTTKSANVVYNFAAPAFSSASWSVIDAVSRGGDAPTYWAVGNTKDISISGETLTFEIVGFNHDDLQSGGKAGITLGMKHLMKNTRQMNSTSTNEGSFVGSDMYDYLNGTFYNGMPSDLKSVIKSVNKETGRGNGSSSNTRTDAMKIFLFSEQEVFGSKTYSVGNEGNKYSRFTTSSTRIKKLNNGAGSAHYWWLRSPNSGNSNNFCNVNSDGTANSYFADRCRGVCAGFCV